MLFRRLAAPITGVVLAVTAGPGLHAQELTAASYAKWRDHILPTKAELAYRGVAWRPSYWEAVVEAQEKDKPILLWVMNGHALCNT